ncbi:restriction endonuclease subunit S [Myroides odoratus]|uniref:restriction endonuclease subunit S n=1 Tax=Myroides odoratus TaxID=256 RepID=UPI00030063D0|nr:restriction endonuclease subunit S [Myroides odoratus]WQD56132.1 restriction endonuclease subunit S [Myroides odoratus]
MIKMTSKRLKDKKVPNLRFPGFEEEWKTKKLGDLLEFKNGINATKEQYGNGYKFINVLDILSNEFITYDKIIGSVNVTNEIINKFPVNYGDILFQRSSETREEVGTTSVYLDKHKTATFGGFVIRGKQIGEYEPIFLNKALKTSFVRNQITSKSGGSTRYNVGQEILASVTLSLPSIIEQQKIASFLSLIDERITTQNKIIEELETLKTSISKKIFSQNLRFKDNNGNEFSRWEFKEIGDVFTITRGNVLSMSLLSNDKDNENNYPVYSSQTKNKGLAGYYNNFIFENAITWTTDGANAGDVNYREGKFYCTNVCGVLLNSNGNANHCIAELINSVSHKYVSYVGNPKLMNGTMSSIVIPFPSIQEQQKISNILVSLNTKIDIENTFLQKLDNQKKYLLDNLFV